MAQYHLVILGDPKAQGRPRATTRGKFATVYEDKKDKQNKATIAVIAQQKAPAKLLTGPLRVDIYWYFARPKSHYGTGRNADKLKESAPDYHTSRPDRDNLDKLVLDALTGVFWRDDNQVCKGEIEKLYGVRPRTEIIITELEQADGNGRTKIHSK